MDEGGSYTAFVWAAYVITFVILGGITMFSVLKHRKLKKQEKEC